MAIRKIKSEQEILARQKKMQLIVSLVMVGLLVMATAGYFASEFLGGGSEQPSNKINYAGRTFLTQGDILTLLENNRAFYFYGLPNESRNIYLENSSFQDFVGKPLYIVNLQPEIQLILTNLEGTYLRWQAACLEEPCIENLPIKNCTENVIIFLEEESQRNLVEKEENCIKIYGDPKIGVDAISYKLLGIK